MKRMILFMALTLIPLAGISQLVISAGTDVVAATGTTMTTTSSVNNQSLKTDLSNLKLVLAATGTTAQGLVNGTLRPLPVGGITINSNATFALAGEWLVKNEMIFTKGKLVVDKFQAIPGKLGYQGTTALVGNDDSYVNGRIFMLSSLSSSQAHTFPIGNNIGYFPAQLEIAPEDATNGVGMEVITTPNPGFTTAVGDIKEVFTDHFWEVTAGTTGTFASPKAVSLSKNGTDSFFIGDGDAIILELSGSLVQTNLGGSVNDPYYTSTSLLSTRAKTLALAKSDDITVKVHKLITPGSDEKNDALYIEGIDSFPDNEVLLIDRWGKEITSWKSFKNAQANFDFTKLDIGNYVCVVKYVKKGKEEIIKQLIVVLK